MRLIVRQRLKPVGGRTWLTRSDGAALTLQPRSAALGKALKAAHEKLAALGAGPLSTAEQLRTASGADNPHLRMILPLAFLAPDVQEAILEGRAPPSMTVSSITKSELPLAWADQRRVLGLGLDR